MRNFLLAQETLGYQTSSDPSNSDLRLLVAGSKNVLIDVQRNVRSRPGYTRLGAANAALTQNRNAWTWNTSTGFKAPQRFYDDELEVYLTSVDGTTINAWTRVSQSWSTTKRLRAATWWDTTENIDLQVMVIGDANIYEWGGGVAIVLSITGTTVTKTGTTTWAQNRFYATRNKTLVCVRTGTEYTYTGGESTTTITGIADTTGLIAGDILVQKIVIQSNKPAASHTNDIIFSFENQIVIGSYNDEEVWLSKNTSYFDFSFSSPRTAGEGVLLTLSDTTRGITSVAKILLIGAGRSNFFTVVFNQISVGSTIAETVKIEKIDAGVNQGFLNQESIVQIGNSIGYLTNEVACRIISDPNSLVGTDPKTYSNPIKPDFDTETWLDSSNNPDAFGVWYKNMLIFTAPQASHMYILNFMEDADGKLKRFWNPPQILPVGPLSIIDLGDGKGEQLYGHSNAVPESYLLFDGASDGQFDGMTLSDKLPIDAKAIYSYNNYGKRGVLKTFDEYYVEGQITPNTTDLLMRLKYNFEGATQVVERTIDGSNEAILEGVVGQNSLSQNSLAINPLGGLLNPPSGTRKFRVIFENAREDFFEMGPEFSTNEVDRFWSILSHGSNAELSKRRAINIKL